MPGSAARRNRSQLSRVRTTATSQYASASVADKDSRSASSSRTTDGPVALNRVDHRGQEGKSETLRKSSSYQIPDEQTSERATDHRERTMADDGADHVVQPVSDIRKPASTRQRRGATEPRQVEIDPLPLTRLVKHVVEVKEQPMVNPVAMNKDQRKTSASSHDVCHRFLPESGCASGFLPAPRASARTGWNSFFSGCVPTQFPLQPTTGPIEKGGGSQELSPRPGRGGSTGCGARQHPAEIDRGSASQVLGPRSFPRRSPE